MGRFAAPRAPSRPAGRGQTSVAGSTAARLIARVLALSLFGSIATALVLTSVFAQVAANGAAAPADKAKMLVEADELVQNSDNNTVSAVGNARIYYKGKTLEADKVIYNKTTKRLFAMGHAKLTEPDGTIYHGETFDLTDDFREGFVNSLRSDTAPGPNATHYSAPRMERIGGNTTVFTKGTYTACDSCKDDPDKPPLWSIRAKRIIHKNDEQMIYYESAYLEFLGIPVAYVPFMSAPDPSVKKKSGILAPITSDKSQLGYGVGVPVFYNLAPDYDLTLTPTYYSTQGFFGAGEFRQTFDTGTYYVRATGIDQEDPGEFAAAPFGAGFQKFRYDVTTKGEFQINNNWKFGWNIAVLSDKYYLTDYSIPADSTSSNYFTESISTIYLTGQGDRSYFDLRGFYTQGLAPQDIQAQQPIAAPVLDYNRTFDVDPAKTHGIGGQVEADFNLTSLSSQSASYQSVGAHTLDTVYGLYDVCSAYQPGTTAGTSCLLRGIGGDQTRVTGQLTYQRKYIDPLGEVWTPFAFARVNGEELSLNTTGVYTFTPQGVGVPSGGVVSSYASQKQALLLAGTTAYTNASQTAFLPSGSGTTGYVVPGVGVEYRYPFMTTVPFGSVVLEPIGQVIARPDAVIGTQTLVNLDAQSLVFDSANLFDWNKYSGYDRFETGVRANYGGQASLNLNNGGYAHVMIGQSAQLAGTNSYATADAANVGLSSGLDTTMSDYVAGATFSPAPFISIGGQGRFDVATLENRRVDATMNLNFGKLTGAVQFANYEAQPIIGYDVRREGLALSSRYDFIEHYFVSGNVTFDMSRHLYPEAIIGVNNPGPYFIAGLGLGVGYVDECTTFTINYSQTEQLDAVGTYVPNQTVLVTLQLRTLGGTSYSRSTQTNTAQNLDGTH